jgi:hypothetical protein
MTAPFDGPDGLHIVGIITLTKHDPTNSSQARQGSDLPGGLVAAAVGNVGVAIYPGQSPELVLKIADIIESELDNVPHYYARAAARRILKELDQR